MGWCSSVASSHARRLERQGWLERHRMTRGKGSLLVATRRGVRMSGLAVGAAATPAPTWWDHDCACAWTAAWLSVRGREWRGPREVLADPELKGELEWLTGTGWRRSGHRPDLAVVMETGTVAIEVELQRKADKRLRAILGPLRPVADRAPDHRTDLRVPERGHRQASPRDESDRRATRRRATPRAAKHRASRSDGTGGVIWLAASLVAFLGVCRARRRRRLATAQAHDPLGAKPLPARRRDLAALWARDAGSSLGCAARARAAGRRTGGRRTFRAAVAACRLGCGRGAPRTRAEPEMVLAAQSYEAARRARVHPLPGRDRSHAALVARTRAIRPDDCRGARAAAAQERGTAHLLLRGHRHRQDDERPPGRRRAGAHDHSAVLAIDQKGDEQAEQMLRDIAASSEDARSS